MAMRLSPLGMVAFVGGALMAQEPRSLISVADSDRLLPENAIRNLELYPGLEASLFASEPMISSVTNLDIDHKGRVWVCDVRNYREHGARNTRPEGDRILILEDTDGDGVADSSKVYYQGRDVDAALGICVLGNQVIVSCAPNIIRFTDTDGDDLPDRKEYLFTKTGRIQGDHSTHSVVYGPDGKLYWNFGNSGQHVHDKDGKLVIDKAGNPVFDRSHARLVDGYDAEDTPYRGGMVFRCNPDGSELETLAHNFRNNYEVAVDSFGGLWQSDNDVDGNFAVRLNYILEYGNYGFLDELSGASWSARRVSEHPEIPKRHWHQNDPGVVPNFVHTGAGSPTGITVYEGSLLPEVFHGQVLHCDAGPGVVWAAVQRPDGAGFAGEMVNLLKEAKRGWARPVDVATAPDGSVFVTDWYDPVVSWNRQYDIDKGRIYRLAPKGHRYEVEQNEFHSPSVAAEALRNPNSDVRYLARSALLEFDKDDSQRELQRLFQDPDPFIRARALWLLARLEAGGQDALRKALSDPDPRVRVAAIRAARQEIDELIPFLHKAAQDPSAQVRSECAIALRGKSGERVNEIWIQLANQLDADDRWNLEAMGIAADGRWDSFLGSWLDSGADWKSDAGRRIVWRSRAVQTPGLLAQCLVIDGLEEQEIRGLIRAFYFQPDSPAKWQALESLAYHPWTGGRSTDWLIASEAFKRLSGTPESETSRYQDAVSEFLRKAPISEGSMALIAQFGNTHHFESLIRDTILRGDDRAKANMALRGLLDAGQVGLLQRALEQGSDKDRSRIVGLLSEPVFDESIPILEQVVLDPSFPDGLRRKAIWALGGNRRGSEALVALAREGRFPENLKTQAGEAITRTMHVRAFDEAMQYFPIPEMKGSEPLPGMTDLVVLQGDIIRGKEVFVEATCATCHQVGGEGIPFGPDLSQIGGKFPKTGLFESILNPNASVSESYQTTTIRFRKGDTQTGILTSETSDSATLLLPGGVSQMYPKSDIVELETSEESLMPAGMQQLMSLDDLVDLVEYLSSLN